MLSNRVGSHEIPLAVAGTNTREGVMNIEMIQRVRAYKEDPNDVAKRVEVGEGLHIEFGITLLNVEHPLKKYMQGEDRLPWQKILIARCVEEAKKKGVNKVRVSSGLSSKYLGYGLPLGLAITEYDRQVIDGVGWHAFNSKGVPIPPEDIAKIKNVFRRITKGKIERMDQVMNELNEDKTPAYWELVI